ncbi:MAG TPA: DUF692 family multinuclear iron-containing protein [Cellvibrionaceae bacterium]
MMAEVATVVRAVVVVAAVVVQVVLVGVAAVAVKDHFGLGWRGPLAAGILAELEQLDCLEIIAEAYDNLPSQQRHAVKYLSRQIPVTVHGVSLGLAANIAPSRKCIEKLARLGDELQAQTISEHLSFVRSQITATGSSASEAIEIGHLAAPPRNNSSVQRCCEHIQSVTKTFGRPLVLENIASLITPLGSELTETQWLTQILTATCAPFLLDLENLYANALNNNENPHELLIELPLNQVHTIHLSGGSWIETDWQKKRHARFLDDHQQDIPPTVFDLLEQAASLAPQSLTIIIERDGNFPSMKTLLEQLEKAKAAVTRVRAHTQPHRLKTPLVAEVNRHFTHNDNARIEHLLAQLFSDESQHKKWLENPQQSLADAHLGHFTDLLDNVDWIGVHLMARSVSLKNRKNVAKKNLSDESLRVASF